MRGRLKPTKPAPAPATRPRRGGVAAHPSRPQPAPRPPAPRPPARRTEGPQDRALYVCRCGSAFQAAVTASVRCPHCGEAQAW